MKRQFEASIRRAFRRPVPEMMAKHSHISLPGARKTKWTVINANKVSLEDVSDHLQLVKRGRELLLGKYNLRSGYETSVITMFKAARLVHVDQFEGKRRSYAFNEVSQGTVLSVATGAEGNIITKELCGTSSLRAYAVVILVRGPDSALWAICVPMEKKVTQIGRGCCIVQDGCALVELSDAVRRAGAVHVCDENCRADPKKLEMCHSKGVLDGGLYEVWTRKDNYPPYMG